MCKKKKAIKNKIRNDSKKGFYLKANFAICNF